MHHPPEVQFSVRAAAWSAWLALMVGLLAMLQVAWFALMHPWATWQMAATVGSLFVGMVWAWRSTQRTSVGSLQWDGLQWRWSGCAAVVAGLQRHVDGQSWMLVSLQFAGCPTIWLWLRRRHDPLNWFALRRAVVFTTTLGPGHRASDSTSVVPHTAS